MRLFIIAAALFLSFCLTADDQPVTAQEKPAAVSDVKDNGFHFLVFSFRNPLELRPLHEEITESAQSELEQNAGIRTDLKKTQSVKLKKTDYFLYSFGLYSPPSNRSTHGIRISISETNYLSSDNGIAVSLLSSDLKRVIGVQSALTGKAETMYGAQALPVFAIADTMYGIQGSLIAAKLETGAGIQSGGWAAFSGKTFSGLQTAIAGSFSHDFHGFQFSGICGKANRFDGLQLSGFGNEIHESLNGLQVAGIVNAAKKEVNGAQISSLGNVVKQLNGTQVSLCYNAADHLNGAQISGVGSAAFHANGAQIAGTVNLVKEASGAQIAGLGNSAKTINGAQISLLFNSTDHLRGLQFGLFNRAKKSGKGFQIGLLNYIADSPLKWFPFVNVKF